MCLDINKEYYPSLASAAYKNYSWIYKIENNAQVNPIIGLIIVLAISNSIECSKLIVQVLYEVFRKPPFPLRVWRKYATLLVNTNCVNTLHCNLGQTNLDLTHCYIL